MEFAESPLASVVSRSGFSPPSPVLDLAPMRFMAIASARCASSEMAPKLMALVSKRFTMESALSTSSRGTGPEASGTNSRRSRSMMARPLGWSAFEYSEKSSGLFSRTARCNR